MSDSIYLDSRVADDVRREMLFQGDLFVYSPRPSTLDFVAFARRLVEDAFQPLDSEVAQYHMSVEQYAEILGKLKPQFIHEPESKWHLQAILRDFGCDLGQTYFDVPRMRSSTSDNFLTTGIAYAWHPHRDTWYSAPPCQLNWWIPIYDIQSENAMAIHPNYWNRPVRNSSQGYNYYLWNEQHRGGHVAQYVKQDPRPLPKPTEPMELDPQTRIIVPAGGMIVFSGAQMHSSVPNTSGKTRFSIDFRTVNVDDALARRGAPKTDEECTGTTMRDYLRGSDFSHIPEDIIAMYDDETAAQGQALYADKANAANKQ